MLECGYGNDAIEPWIRGDIGDILESVTNSGKMLRLLEQFLKGLDDIVGLRAWLKWKMVQRPGADLQGTGGAPAVIFPIIRDASVHPALQLLRHG
ncbi:MAG: hypothetical protein WBM40_20185 [Thiohalocapsa sp.]